jgi:ferritin-like metal-binding protein YciE
MAINSLQEKFTHELGDIYDAEHQFLKGQEEMLQNATDPQLKQMIQQHMEQTRGHIRNLEQVFNLMGQQPQRVMCDGAKGLVSEGQKLIKETAGADAVRDCAIAGAAHKVEHYEIASYWGLITGAELMGQQEIVSVLQQNLQQEEQTAALIEQSTPMLLQTAMQAEGMTMQQGQYGQTYTS